MADVKLATTDLLTDGHTYVVQQLDDGSMTFSREGDVPEPFTFDNADNVVSALADLTSKATHRVTQVTVFNSDGSPAFEIEKMPSDDLYWRVPGSGALGQNSAGSPADMTEIGNTMKLVADL